MKILYISVVLLLFEFHSISGYKISHEIQAKSDKTAHRGNDTEVYEVLEDDARTVQIVYPKADKPTLREIVYYHVVETPYEQDPRIRIQEPEVDVRTERPFTNSHGFQFLTEDPEKNDSIEKDSSSDTEIFDVSDLLLNVDDDLDDSSSTSEEDEIITTTRKPIRIRANATTTTPATTTALVIEATSRDNEEEDVTVEPPEKIESPTNTVDKMEEKKHSRSVLFNQARNKYQNFRKNPSPRRRRNINMEDIPEAPMLAPLSLDGLPEYVKKLIYIPESKTAHKSNAKPKAKSQFDEDEFKEELHHKIEDMIFSLKPDKDSVEHLNDGEVETKMAPRTYGMNLTMGSGHVWNELWNKPVSFDIGDIESTESEEAEPFEESSETPEITGEHIFSFIPHPTEQKPSSSNGSGEISNESEETDSEEITAEDYEASSGDSEATDDIYVNVNRPKAAEFSSEEVIDKRKDEIETDKMKTDKDFVKTEKAKEFDETAKDKNIKDRKELAQQPEILQQLMENEQFWKWLSGWTETYMELLIQHVKKMVHDEVSRQIKKLKKEITEDNQKHNIQLESTKEKEDKGSQTEEMKDDNLTIDGKEIPLTHTSNFDDEGHEALSKLKHRKDKKKQKETELLEKVPEPSQEIPITALNEVNETEHSKDKTPANVTATNIFGNSVGTDKVTNIFIFYPKDNDIIKDLKPFINESSNVFGVSAIEAGVTVDERFSEKITAEKELDDKQVDNESKIEETNNQIKPVQDKDANISSTPVASEKEDKKEVIPEKEENKEDEKKVGEGSPETDKKESQDVKEDSTTTEDATTTLKPEPKEDDKTSTSEGDKEVSENKEDAAIKEVITTTEKSEHKGEEKISTSTTTEKLEAKEEDKTTSEGNKQESDNKEQSEVTKLKDNKESKKSKRRRRVTMQ